MSEETVVQESGVIEVKATKTGFDPVVTTFDFGANLDEMVEKFGGEVVFTQARAAMKIALQGIMRRYLENGKSVEEIAAIAADWKPGVQMERTVDPIAAARKAMATMDDAEKQAFIEKLLG